MNFFCDDETSSVSLNVKDFVTIYRDEKKLKLKVRYMQFTVKEAYQKFKKQNLGDQIGFSKFAELKLTHVRSLTKIAHNVCCFLIHENMHMALESLKKLNPTLLSNLYVGNIMQKNFVCESPFISFIVHYH